MSKHRDEGDSPIGCLATLCFVLLLSWMLLAVSAR